MIYTAKAICRSCNSPLREVLSLGTQRLAAWLDRPGQDSPEAPLDLMACVNNDCSLVQLRHTVEADLLFRHADYGYRSSLNGHMIQVLQDVAYQTMDKIQLKDGDTIIDIGANDGTLLRSYPHHANFNLVGFEPIEKFKPYWDDIGMVINNYFSAEDYSGPAARIVTAIAMFYDLDDPNTFVRDVHKVMADDGVFVIQVSYLPFMYATGDYMTMCHEHLEYYSLKALEYLLNQNGLYVFDAAINDINGGSLRVYASKERKAQSYMLQSFQAWEASYLSSERGSHLSFANRVKELTEDLLFLLYDLKSRGKTIYAYTASTKGQVLLQYAGLGPDTIDAASDINKDKWGKYCAGSDIPVISEEQARRGNPDYYLLLAWFFLDTFVKRERGWIDGGGRFILPMPSVSLVP